MNISNVNLLGIERAEKDIKMKVTLRDEHGDIVEKLSPVVFFVCLIDCNNRIAHIAICEADLKTYPAITMSDILNMMGNHSRPIFTKHSGKKIAAFGGYFSR